MGEAKRRREKSNQQAQQHDVDLTRQMTLPERVVDYAAKNLAGEAFWRRAEAARKAPSAMFQGVPSHKWSEWCYLPVNAAAGILGSLMENEMSLYDVEREYNHKIRLLTALTAWRVTKGVYVFDPDVVRALAESEVDDDMPDDLFLQMPDWCQYVSTPGLKLYDGLCIHGFFAYLDDRAWGNSRHYPPELNFEVLIDPKLSEDDALLTAAIADIELQYATNDELDRGIITEDQLYDRLIVLAREKEFLQLHMNVPLGRGTFRKAFLEQSRDMVDYAPSMAHLMGHANQAAVKDALDRSALAQARLASLLLYLVSEKADISHEGEQAEMRNRVVLNDRRGIRNFQAPQIRAWEVGYRIGAQIRAFDEKAKDSGEGTGTGTSMRPHVRKAHWHSFWTGPRDTNDRKKRVKWLPPIPVNVSGSDDLVPTAHKVEA